jgi:diguanylate cyclase (GGDEF)-like protein
MENIQLNNNLYEDSLTGLPNFFNFMEADINKVFDKKGTFIVFNMLNLTQINESYGVDIGDSCIKSIAQAILAVTSTYSNIFIFRFGRNDFITIIPYYLHISVENIISQIEVEFSNNIDKVGFESFKLNKLIINYNEEIKSIENFYELLLNNALVNDRNDDNSYTSKRLLIHVINTFTSNIRNTLSVYNNACELALKDDISGLHNHRAGKAFLVNLIEEYKIQKTGFSVLFIDGDDLKRYNGISYEAGNEMIRTLSQIIASSIRSEDKVYRWLSGDEFLVVLQRTNEMSAIKLADRIRVTVQEQTKNLIYPTTISIGVSIFPQDGNSLEEIVDKAEKANGIAKGLGKNKVVQWDNPIKTL